MARHLELGENSEELAARYLIRKGMSIVARRVRYRCGELDLVARQGREWVFVEVKSRRGDRKGRASESFTATKSQRMRRAVEMYVRDHGLDNEPIRCDFVAIDFSIDGVPEIRHYPGGIHW